MDSFHKRFNIPINLEEARRRFINRVKLKIFDKQLDFGVTPLSNPKAGWGTKSFSSYVNLEEYCEVLAYHLGHNLENYKKDDILTTFYSFEYCLKDFSTVLQSVEVLYKTISKSSNKKVLTRTIESILSSTEVNIGIFWKNGKFYPSGAKFLDKKLVNDVLDWINEDEERYSNVKPPFEKGLSHYLRATNKPELLADVITDMYESLEALAKKVTQKDKELSGNRELFVNRLKLHKCYKQMLKEYINYGCEFRHAPEEGKPRILPKPHEAEAFIYLTGLFIRLGMKSLEQTEAR